MVKYNLTAGKLKTIKVYLAVEDRYLAIARKFGIASNAIIVKWVRIYLKHGEKGLDRKQNISCSI